MLKFDRHEMTTQAFHLAGQIARTLFLCIPMHNKAAALNWHFLCALDCAAKGLDAERVVFGFRAESAPPFQSFRVVP